MLCQTVLSLTVVYDAECGLCTRVASWLQAQPKWIGMNLVPSTSLSQLYPQLDARQLQEELIVVSDRGGVYFGSRAWIMCLYALKRYRGWALRLARPALLPMARQAFALLSSNRHRISQLLGPLSDSELSTQLRATHIPKCYGTKP
jgi:predicted DCC family thiol-disulfide oxidoreductase YuxK